MRRYARTAIRLLVCASMLVAACTPDRPATTPANDVRAPATAGGSNEPALARVNNPYTGNADAIAQGEQLFVSKACSSCHGVAGVGGMCPPLINDTWVYGSDDTTLFNLIRLGSAGLQAKGRARVGHEPQVGDMPSFAGAVSDDEAWQLIAYIRSKYAGNPALRNW